MPLNCGKISKMWVLIASVILGLLLPGSKVQGYDDYDDIGEEGGEDDYINYYMDEEAPVVTLATPDEDEEFKSNRIRRDQDEEAVGTKTLSPEDLSVVKGALNQLLSRMSNDKPITPYAPPSMDYRPSIGLNTSPWITNTAPSYTVEEISTQTEDLTSVSRIINDEDTLTSILEQASDDYYNKGWPNKSSKIAHEIENNNSDRLSSIKVLKEGELVRRDGSTTAMAAEMANVTATLNESNAIANLSIPTCVMPPRPPTTVRTTVTDEYDANYTGAVIAKCFVCGLDIPGIPQHAHCADAFAGDFLPLVPVDTSAKGKISRFRKYCKYANIRGYRTKSSQPRVIIGAWTGGCAVRWVDLSGVYTQRTCRNRMQPTMGLHYGSKRMAKLEKSLWNLEDGCIVSPVATLTPLSRGVSLYARFHACVCSGNWCNAARVDAPYRRLVLFTALIGLSPSIV